MKTKTGQTVYWLGKPHLFLGYSDYKRTVCVIADSDGNKYTLPTTEIITIL